MAHPRLQRLAAVQAKAERWLADTARRLAHSQSQDSSGQIVDTWTAGATFSCAFDSEASRELTVGAQVVITDGRLWYQKGESLTAEDRVRIVSRYGSTLTTSLSYNIVGDPQDDALLGFVDLQRVDPWKEP